MKCTNCGNDNVKEAVFCEHCGTKLEAEKPAAAPVAEKPVAAPVATPVVAEKKPAAKKAAAPAPKKKGKAKLIIIIAAIVTFLAAVGVVGWFGFCAEYPWFVDESIIGIGVVEAPVVDDSNDKEEIEEMLGNYIAAAKVYDAEEANKFLNEEDDNLFGGGAEEFKKEISEECSADATIAFCEQVIDKWADSREMSVKEINKDGDKYICTIEINQIDEEEIEEIMMSAIDKESELLGEETELSEEALDELNGYLEDSLEEVNALEPVTTETEVVVIKVDGEWKIDAEESDLY